MRQTALTAHECCTMQREKNAGIRLIESDRMLRPFKTTTLRTSTRFIDENQRLRPTNYFGHWRFMDNEQHLYNCRQVTVNIRGISSFDIIASYGDSHGDGFNNTQLNRCTKIYGRRMHLFHDEPTYGQLMGAAHGIGCDDSSSNISIKTFAMPNEDQTVRSCH